MTHPRAVPLDLAGGTYQLVFDLNAMVLLRQQHGLNMLAPADSDWTDPVAIRAMLWAGLQREHPECTLDWVGAVVTLKEWPAATQAIMAAYQQAQATEVASPLGDGASPSP